MPDVVRKWGARKSGEAILSLPVLTWSWPFFWAEEAVAYIDESLHHQSATTGLALRVTPAFAREMTDKSTGMSETIPATPGAQVVRLTCPRPGGHVTSGQEVKLNRSQLAVARFSALRSGDSPGRF